MEAANSKIDLRSELFLVFMFIPLIKLSLLLSLLLLLWLLLLISLAGKKFTAFDVPLLKVKRQIGFAFLA